MSLRLWRAPFRAQRLLTSADGLVRIRRAMVPVMMTVSAAIARSDCLSTPCRSDDGSEPSLTSSVGDPAWDAKVQHACTRATQRKIRYAAIVGMGRIAQVAVLPAFQHAEENSELPERQPVGTGPAVFIPAYRVIFETVLFWLAPPARMQSSTRWDPARCRDTNRIYPARCSLIPNRHPLQSPPSP